MDTIEKFIKTELNNQKIYNEIMNFILSSNIRIGEFEGNEYVLKKIDLDNFFIYKEYKYIDGKDICNISCYNKLFIVKQINDYVSEHGIKIIKVHKSDIDIRYDYFGNTLQNQKVNKNILSNDVRELLVNEIKNQKQYDSIIKFILSFEIRNGEIKYNTLVINKMDQCNFLIYNEKTNDIVRTVNFSTYMNKLNLLELINDCVKNKKISILNFDECDLSMVPDVIPFSMKNKRYLKNLNDWF